jgi:hypothetical protein
MRFVIAFLIYLVGIEASPPCRIDWQAACSHVQSLMLERKELKNLVEMTQVNLRGNQQRLEPCLQLVRVSKRALRDISETEDKENVVPGAPSGVEFCELSSEFHHRMWVEQVNNPAITDDELFKSLMDDIDSKKLSKDVLIKILRDLHDINEAARSSSLYSVETGLACVTYGCRRIAEIDRETIPALANALLNLKDHLRQVEPSSKEFTEITRLYRRVWDQLRGQYHQHGAQQYSVTDTRFKE